MTVFANSLEISAKAQGCKIIAAFPDTCFTPPQTPATPPGVPIPYPNFATDSDLTSGTGTVKIGGQEVSQENASKFSRISGDEAGCAPKKGIITSKNMGKAYAQKWSMDVKAEGKGVVRFTDLATTNHASNTGNDAPWLIVGKPGKPGFRDTDNCLVGSYGEIKDKCNARGGEAHHIIPDEYLRDGTRDESTPAHETFPPIDEACAICVGGKSSGKSQAERQSDTGKKIAEKADEYAADKKVRSLSTGRGHGYMHYFFDASFGNNARPIGDAVDIAKQALTNCAAYKSAVVDPDCAEAGKDCVEKQFENACARDPQPTCKANTRKSNERFDNARDRLSRDGHLNQDLMPTRHSSLT
jgi:hypothetical protein